MLAMLVIWQYFIYLCAFVSYLLVSCLVAVTFTLRDTLDVNVVSEIFNQLHGAELFSKIDSYCFGKLSAVNEPIFQYHWILSMFHAVR